MRKVNCNIVLKLSAKFYIYWQTFKFNRRGHHVKRMKEQMSHGLKEQVSHETVKLIIDNKYA